MRLGVQRFAREALRSPESIKIGAAFLSKGGAVGLRRDGTEGLAQTYTPALNTLKTVKMVSASV